VDQIQGILESVGLENQRIRMINVSAAMGGQFALSAEEYTEEIRLLGPNPLKEK
jgi:coenzyme F420-reducing hydrogenase delta subunit